MTLTSVLEAIVEPHRREIVDVLSRGERPVGELADRLGLSQPSASKHLRVLRDAGLVDVRVDGTRRLYRLRGEALSELASWVEERRRLWTTSLDRLEKHVASRRMR